MNAAPSSLHVTMPVSGDTGRSVAALKHSNGLGQHTLHVRALRLGLRAGMRNAIYGSTYRATPLQPLEDWQGSRRLGLAGRRTGPVEGPGSTDLQTLQPQYTRIQSLILSKTIRENHTTTRLVEGWHPTRRTHDGRSAAAVCARYACSRGLRALRITEERVCGLSRCHACARRASPSPFTPQTVSTRLRGGSEDGILKANHLVFYSLSERDASMAT